MLISALRDHPVMSLASASRVGRVAEVVIDPHRRRLVALRLRKTPGDGDTLHWDDVAAIGPDAVTVADEGRLVPPRDDAAALLGKDHAPTGKRLLTSAGDEVGHVDDVEIDPDSGAVVRLLTSQGDVAGERLLGCGSYAVVVRAAD